MAPGIGSVVFPVISREAVSALAQSSIVLVAR